MAHNCSNQLLIKIYCTEKYKILTIIPVLFIITTRISLIESKCVDNLAAVALNNSSVSGLGQSLVVRNVIVGFLFFIVQVNVILVHPSSANSEAITSSTSNPVVW